MWVWKFTLIIDCSYSSTRGILKRHVWKCFSFEGHTISHAVHLISPRPLSASWVVKSHCTFCHPKTMKNMNLLNWNFFIHKFYQREITFSFQAGFFRGRESKERSDNNKELTLCSHDSVTSYVHYSVFIPFTIPCFEDWTSLHNSFLSNNYLKIYFMKSRNEFQHTAVTLQETVWNLTKNIVRIWREIC